MVITKEKLFWNNRKKKSRKPILATCSSALNLKTIKRLNLRLKNNRLNRRLGLRLVYRSNNLFMHIVKSVFRRARRRKLVKRAKSYFYTSTGSFGFKNAMKSSSTTIDKVCDRFMPFLLQTSLQKRSSIPGRWKRKRQLRGIDVFMDPYRGTRWLLWLLVNRLKRSKIQAKNWIFYDNTPFGGTKLRKNRRK